MNYIDRRRFLLSAGLLGIGAFSVVFRSVGDDEDELSVDFSVAGIPIPEDFLGLSFETAELLLDLLLLPGNHSLISLIRHLGPKGVIRIGGNSSDRPSLRKGLKVQRSHIEHLAGFLSATGWRLIYGLDLGSGTAEQAAAEAEMVAQLVGPKLLAFQIGNEPDDFRYNVRKQGYNHPDYIAEWRNFSQAIKARVPSAPLAGPDVGSDTSWLLPFAHNFGREVSFLTCHYYSEGPAGSPNISIEGMLGTDKTLASVIDAVAKYTAESGLQVRMTESNSVWDGGKLGVSDTLAAAIWGVDVMFTLAQARWLGVNFHGRGDSYYSPIGRTSSGAIEPKPLYYAMRLFAETGRGSLVPIQRRVIRPRLRVFAVRGPGGERRIILVNTDLSRNERVRIAAEGRDATILRLTARSAESESGITLGGTSVSPTGDWTPRAAQLVARKNDRFVVDVPAVTAAVVQIHPT
jgi:hypothetical protein